MLNLPGVAQGATAAGQSVAKTATATTGFSSVLLALANLEGGAAVKGTATLLTQSDAASKPAASEDKENEPAAASAAAALVQTMAPVGLAAPQPELAAPLPAQTESAPATAPEIGAAFLAAAKAKAAAAVADATGDQTQAAAPQPIVGLAAAPGSPASPQTNTAAPDATANTATTTDALNAGTAAQTQAPATGGAAPTPATAPISSDLATALVSQSVQDTLQKDPTAVLDQARAATTEQAATSRASGTQSAVLEAVRDLGAPSTSSAPATPDPVKFSPPASPPAHNAPEPLAPKPDIVAHAKPEPAAPAAAAQNAAQSAQAAVQDRPPVPTDQSSTLQPVQDPGTSTPANVARPEAASQQPQAMTVIKATETQNGVPVLPTEQIAVTVARQLRQGTNRFEIRLDPPELGRIDVRLDLTHGGRATATLTVDRPETLQLLSRDAKVLQQALSDAGLKADTGSLNFTLRDQSAQQQMLAGQGQGGGRQSLNENVPREAKSEAPATTTVLLTTSIEPGRLDMRV